MTSPTDTWQQAWQSAQPQLSRARESVTSVSPLARVTRVGQLDSELLDQELVQVLKEPLEKAFSLVNSAWKARFEPELVLFIQLVLYKLSVWNDGASYGARLQGLKYDLPRGYIRSRTLLIHGSLTLLVPYAHTRIRAHALSHAWPDAPSSDRRRKAWEFLSRLESLHSLLGLANFIAFLYNSRYRTLIDRLLNMRLVSARRLVRRDVSYEFMNRQMVWHAFTEFLLFLLPLINTRALRRRISNFASQLSPGTLLPHRARSLLGLSTPETSSAATSRRGKYWALPADQCAICAEDASARVDFADPANALASMSNSAYTSTDVRPDASADADAPPAFPIHSPYMTSCGHVYCYYCVSARMLRTAEEHAGVGPGGSHWACLRCTEGVTGAERVAAQAEGPEYESGVEDDDEGEYEYEYGSSEDLEFTDMSGSVGSYSESGMSE
ncbi:hypothetical protein WOLCODRAFT_118481 [Wolfiporia cocos MD-104 SS10]|uniref:RING-type E3 ubiquitin transferase (cysteine targeting) n=1 Tax=Wolfiporia cocos (strain MD-104) TaxID=742152 RepID=A0A2H3JI46_WOLCO|nr:hypothetical protein WOLCODRAFT_118481 [Wolfiporia cocos MD-104 SS10]